MFENSSKCRTRKFQVFKKWTIFGIFNELLLIGSLLDTYLHSAYYYNNKARKGHFLDVGRKLPGSPCRTNTRSTLSREKCTQDKCWM